MGEPKIVKISIFLNENQIEMAAETKKAMQQYDQERYGRYKLEGILHEAIVRNLSYILNEVKESYEWLAKYEKEHPEEVGDKKEGESK